MSILDFLDSIPNRIFPKLESFSFPLYITWREFCHIITSCLIILISFFIYKHGIVYAPITVFSILGIYMTWQEFYLHPKKYNQMLWNGILDWLAWMIPFMVYLLLLY